MNAPALTLRSRVSLRVRVRWGWQNLCRLLLTKPGFQVALVLAITGWWFPRRDIPATLAAISLIMILSTWMMHRERIRRHLAADKSGWQCGSRPEDDWTPLVRPLLTLDEINTRRRRQEQKDRTAFRLGLACTLLAAVIGVAGFQK
jgi:hypothetical protein